MATGQFSFFPPQRAVSLFGILPAYQRALESSTLLFTGKNTWAHLRNVVFVLYQMIQPQLTPLKEGDKWRDGAELKRL